MESIVDRYRRLPEAKHIPDEIWEMDKIYSLIQDYEERIMLLHLEMSQKLPALMKILHADWNDDDLKKAGLFPMKSVSLKKKAK
jgi:hypothetical protein